MMTSDEIGRLTGKTGTGLVIYAVTELVSSLSGVVPDSWLRLVEVAAKLLIVVGLIHKMQKHAELVEDMSNDPPIRTWVDHPGDAGPTIES